MKLLNAGLTGLTAASFLSLPAQADPGDAYHGYHMWDAGWHGGFHGPLMMIVVFAILLAVIIAVGVVVVRSTGRSGQTSADVPSSQNPALDILRERFARGEMDTEEFEQCRQALDA